MPHSNGYLTSFALPATRNGLDENCQGSSVTLPLESSKTHHARLPKCRRETSLSLVNSRSEANQPRQLRDRLTQTPGEELFIHNGGRSTKPQSRKRPLI